MVSKFDFLKYKFYSFYFVSYHKNGHISEMIRFKERHGCKKGVERTLWTKATGIYKKILGPRIIRRKENKLVGK